MEITNELLAAYAEGNVTPEERKQIRQYLTEHPSQLESVMLMMDSDNDLEAKQNRRDISFKGLRPPQMRDVSFTSAALVPSAAHDLHKMMDSLEPMNSMTFDERLDDLLNELI